MTEIEKEVLCESCYFCRINENRDKLICLELHEILDDFKDFYIMRYKCELYSKTLNLNYLPYNEFYLK